MRGLIVRYLSVAAAVICLGCAPAREAPPGGQRPGVVAPAEPSAVAPTTILAIVGLLLLLALANDVEGDLGTSP